MPFPRRLLDEDEDVVFDHRPHWWAMVGPIVATVLVLALGTVLEAIVPVSRFQKWIQLALVVVALVVLLGYVVPAVVRWRTTHLILTTERLIYRTGLVARHGREIPLERLNDVSYTQSVFERMIRAGDLVIESGGEQGQSRFPAIPDPEGVQLQISRQIDAVGRRRMTPPPPAPAAVAKAEPAAPAPSVLEQLDQLGRLRERGVISDEEFARAKQGLLDRL